MLVYRRLSGHPKRKFHLPTINVSLCTPPPGSMATGRLESAAMMKGMSWQNECLLGLSDSWPLLYLYMIYKYIFFLETNKLLLNVECLCLVSSRSRETKKNTHFSSLQLGKQKRVGTCWYRIWYREFPFCFGRSHSPGTKYICCFHPPNATFAPKQ